MELKPGAFGYMAPQASVSKADLQRVQSMIPTDVVRRAELAPVAFTGDTRDLEDPPQAGISLDEVRRLLASYLPADESVRFLTADDLPDLSHFLTAADLPDLSPYARRDELPDLGPYLMASQLPAALAPYALAADVARALQSTVTNDQLATALASYVRTAQLPDLRPYALKTDIPAAVDLTPYARKTDLQQYALAVNLPDLTAYAKKSDVPAPVDLTPYAKISQLPDMAPYATTVQLASYVTSTQLSSALAPYAKATQLPDVSQYITATALTPYARSSDLAAYATTASLAPYALISQLPDLKPYAKVSQLADYATAATLPTSKIVTSTLGADGSTTINFGTTYAAVPTIMPAPQVVNDTIYWAIPVAGSATTSSVKVTGKKTKGTLLLSSGPVETAPSGSPVGVLVIGRPA